MNTFSQIAYVYWIRLPEHTDVLTQGYVGVSINPSYRFWEHRNDVKRGTHCNAYLSRVILKYNDKLIQSVILKGTTEFCYFIEEKLRSESCIGWNLNKGGICPPSSKGKTLSTEHKKKIGQSNKGKRHSHNEISKKKISNFNKGKVISNEHKQQIKNARKNQIFTEETKKKISKALLGNIPGNAKQVKTPLGTFSSIKKAAEAHQISGFAIRKLLKNNLNYKFI